MKLRVPNNVCGVLTPPNRNNPMRRCFLFPWIHPMPFRFHVWLLLKGSSANTDLYLFTNVCLWNLVNHEIHVGWLIHWNHFPPLMPGLPVRLGRRHRSTALPRSRNPGKAGRNLGGWTRGSEWLQQLLTPKIKLDPSKKERTLGIKPWGIRMSL